MHSAKLIAAFMLSVACNSNALATYQIYLMNNTHEAIKSAVDCTDFYSGACKNNHPWETLTAYRRSQVLSINYDEGIKRGHNFTARINITLPDKERIAADIVVHGDTIGSHLNSISFYQDGHRTVLLDDHNSEDKILPDKINNHHFTTTAGHTYIFYVDTQKDYLTFQGLDSIYFTLDEKPPVLQPKATAHEIGIISWNIKAFPNYIGLDLDLNKMNSRIDYIVHADFMKHTDVIVFQEAWDHDIRKKLVDKLKPFYPYSVDPVPEDDHGRPLYSGLLALSHYPITAHHFIDYQDYQTLEGWDDYSNKGALYFQVNKKGQPYNIIVTHTQAGDNFELKHQEFTLIRKYLIDELELSRKKPLIIAGDFNTDYYGSRYPVLRKELDLSDQGMQNSVHEQPAFSSCPEVNLMIEKYSSGGSLIDYISPVTGFKKPVRVKKQITVSRAVDSNRMYQKSKNMKLYHHGNTELSDHFMIQAVLSY